jgi:hypothetical protein
MFQTKVVEKPKTHISRSITFVENRAVYEIKLNNFVEPGRPQMIIWRMRVAWSHERDHILCYTYLVCLLYGYVFLFIFEVIV